MSAAPLLKLSIALPVLNEEVKLAASVAMVRAAALGFLPEKEFEIVVADNGSTDGTRQAGEELAARWKNVRYTRLEQRGRGRALKAVWLASAAEVLAYMDIDLSTDLRHLRQLHEAVASGEHDVAFGTRLHARSRTERSLRREWVSRIYNLLLRGFLDVGFGDAQCGFKAIRRDIAQLVLPAVRNDNWFFDTELLVKAERRGCRLGEIPVAWREGPGSHVSIWRTALEDIAGIARLRRELGHAGRDVKRVRPECPGEPGDGEKRAKEL